MARAKLFSNSFQYQRAHGYFITCSIGRLNSRIPTRNCLPQDRSSWYDGVWVLVTCHLEANVYERWGATTFKRDDAETIDQGWWWQGMMMKRLSLLCPLKSVELMRTEVYPFGHLPHLMCHDIFACSAHSVGFWSAHVLISAVCCPRFIFSGAFKDWMHSVRVWF